MHIPHLPCRRHMHMHILLPLIRHHVTPHRISSHPHVGAAANKLRGEVEYLTRTNRRNPATPIYTTPH